ncbi:MAG: hypothetical protein WCB51_03225 [Candidatus Dormiibacterota bacterium]
MVRTTLAALAALTIGALAACGSSTTSGSPTPGATSAPPTATATPTPVPTPTPTPSQAPPTVQVTGSWTGQYSGPFNGTFSLTWTQTGSAVDGTIKLSSPPDTLNISGNLTGNAISFGAVGVVRYNGTVSGNSMSGSYLDLANNKTGTWSATKS